MRNFIVASLLVLAAHASAQSAAKTEPAPAAADATVPPLTKTVAVDPNDSPMVRAAKKAVASRVSAGQRRVISITSTNTRGRYAESTGPSEGPHVKPQTTGWTTPIQKPQPSESEKAAAAKYAADIQRQLKKVQAEQGRMANEMDEPYGGDIDEDQAEQRLTQAAAEQQKLEQSAQKPPQF
jgi:hypothetical protein